MACTLRRRFPNALRRSRVKGEPGNPRAQGPWRCSTECFEVVGSMWRAQEAMVGVEGQPCSFGTIPKVQGLVKERRAWARPEGVA